MQEFLGRPDAVPIIVIGGMIVLFALLEFRGRIRRWGEKKSGGN